MDEARDEVSTHVLIPAPMAERLRDLARRTRVTQSEYLREAVLDLLDKYQREPSARGERGSETAHAD